jgi:hypothetical protein
VRKQHAVCDPGLSANLFWNRVDPEGPGCRRTALLERGISVWEQSGGRVGNPGFKPVLAEGMAEVGDLAGALVLIDEVIAQIERPGWGIIMPKHCASGPGC